MPRANSYRLTADLVAAHAGANGIVCLDASAEGRTWPLHAERPDARTNRNAREVLAELRGDVYREIEYVRDAPSAAQGDVILVQLRGPIEERGGYHDPCGGFTAGHDTIYDSLAAAFEIGDVLFDIHSPGGAVSGGPENMRRAREMKAKHGRRCIGFSEGGIHSMALWWAFAICDELWISADARVGTVGARGMLSSISGALAKDGIVVDVFEDPEGKSAGVPELPISDEAKARAQRDVSLAADAFRAAVCAGAIGMRAGLTPEILKSYRADSFTGQAAVDAGFADGISTLEAVMMDALANAGRGAAMPDPENDDKKNEGSDDEPAEQACCARCSLALDPMDSYCRKCGTATVPAKSKTEDEPKKDDDAAPDSSARGSALAARMPGLARAPIAADARAGMSVPALRATVATMGATLDAVARLVGAKGHAEIVGAVEATAKDAAKAIRYRAERDEQRKRSDAKERMDLLLALSAADPAGHPRGKLIVDVVEGEKITGSKPAPLWSDGPEGRTLANLRGYARTVLGSQSGTKPTDANPYDKPPAAPADHASADMAGEIEIAKRDPAVQLAARTTPGATLDDIAKNHVIASRAARRVQVPA